MGGGYNRFKIRTNLYGENSRQAKINDARHILNLEFTNDPSYCDTMYLWIPGENPHKDKHVDIRLFGRKYSSANGNTVQFEMQIGEAANIGNYYYNDETGQCWICTELFYVNEIHYAGKLTLCNWTLKWQTEDGRILEYPCQDINSTQYNSGESGDKTMTLGSAQHMATVQATPDTIALATPQRFFVSRDYKIPFRVTQNDTVANYYGNGLCKITLYQDQLREEDNTELGICDYRNIERPAPPEGQDISIQIAGEPFIKAGYDRDYTAKILDSSGVEVSGVNYQWDVVSDFEVIQKISGKTINLLVPDEGQIGNTFVLWLTTDIQTISKEIQVISAF